MRYPLLCLLALVFIVARSQNPTAEVSELEWRIVPSYSSNGMYGLGFGTPFKQSVDDIEPSKLYLNENEVVLITGVQKDEYALVRLNSKLQVKWQIPVKGIPVKIALIKDKIILVTDSDYKLFGGFSYDYTISTIDPAKGKILQTKKLDSKLNGKPGFLNFLTSETGSYFYVCVLNKEKSSSIKVINLSDDLKEISASTFPLSGEIYKNRIQSDNAGNLYLSSSEDEGMIRVTNYMITGEKKSVISIPFSPKKKGKMCVLYLLLYVDDILIASANKEEIRQLKESLNIEFEMKDLGSARRILGIDIHRDRAKGELFLSQSNYLKKVVERFRMHQSKPVSTPLGHHTKLSVIQAPETTKERSKMNQTPCQWCWKHNVWNGLQQT